MTDAAPDQSTETVPGHYPGAKWWKVDFHAHSPASFDYGAEEGAMAAAEAKPTFREWLLVYMAAGIDAIVITDHNTHEGISGAREAYAALEHEGAEGFRSLSIFVGVEITIEGGDHLLGVFDTDSEPELVNGLLHTVRYQGERGGSNGTTVSSFEQVVDEIIRLGGLAIPAHADTNRGVFSHEPRSADPVFDAGKILAVETVGELTYASAMRAKAVRVLGSDAHHLDDSSCPAERRANAKYPGSHYTWVKMALPSLDGVRHALSDGARSVVPAVGASADPNIFEHDMIEKIAITHGEETTTYQFGPWMNAVIGGRGVGKSTLIEVVRLVLGRTDDLPVRLKQDLEWFAPTPGPSSTARFWGNGTTLAVYISRAGQRYRIAWSGTTGASTIERSGDSGWEAENGAPHDRFTVLVNSQKQIYELAQDPRGLLKMIDEQPEVAFRVWSDEFERLSSRYRALRGELLEIDAEIGHEDRLLGQLADVEAQLALLTQQVESPTAAELNKLLREQRELDAYEGSAEAFEEELRLLLSEYSDLAVTSEALTADSWEHESIWRSTVSEAVASFVETANTLAAARAGWDSVREESPRLARITTLKESLGIADGSDVSGDPTIERTANIVQLRGAKDRIEADLRRIRTSKERRTRLDDETGEVMSRLGRHRSELTKRRQDVAGRLSSGQLKVRVHEQGDDSALEVDLRRLTRKESGFELAFGENGLRSLVVHPFNPTRIQSIGQLKDLLRGMHSSGREALVGAGHANLQIDRRFYPGLQAIDSSSFETDVDLWFPEDGLQVKFTDENGLLKPIDSGSPGQRTAALLAALLSLGSDPLVLDQPEDDLDNKLISQLVVASLRDIKTRRQVIVATHNANIVVNGDAEHVTALDHGNAPKIEASGSMHEATVKDTVCEIMEGGKDALRSRYSRLAGHQTTEQS